ncbi:HTH-type transcriptional activator RhaR [bioreactor metagenome]|uniref:HTH-type transcriptional activator RhaR n=1 Tax=bioreactor metagenome TaxID=1076179 RepID=A0A645EGG3_9ZZZZ|nr:helix-turn-helix domain-containing protein [Oscillospiraceae bacterium]
MSNNHLLITAPIYYSLASLVSRPRHFHAHAEIIHVLSGKLTLQTEDGEFILCEGDTCFIFPNQLHGYYADVPEKHLMINFSAEYCPEFSDILTKKKPVTNVFSVTDKEGYKALFDEAYHSFYSHSPYAEQLCRGYTLVLCAESLSHLELVDFDPANLRTMQLIIKYCLENYTSKLTLEQMASHLHISRHYISHLFSSEMKTGFLEYVNSLRVNKAKSMLESPEERITDIALSCGFENQRTFNRVFLKFCGVTPREYRKALIHEE